MKFNQAISTSTQNDTKHCNEQARVSPIRRQRSGKAYSRRVPKTKIITFGMSPMSLCNEINIPNKRQTICDSGIPLSGIQQNLGNPNASLRVCSKSNMNDSNALRIRRTGGRVKRPLCSINFADSLTMRQHFRTINASSVIK